jgi:molybdate transport system regulatory protein
MKIGVRNQIAATVTAVEQGAVNSLVALQAPKGTDLSAIITNEASKELGLNVGEKVTAFFKASHVLIATQKLPSVSARNKLEGIIAIIKTGAVNTEAVIRLPSGDRLTAIVTNEAATDLSLKEGDNVVAIIKAADVMIAK